jgi:hypothetical protein
MNCEIPSTGDAFEFLIIDEDISQKSFLTTRTLRTCRQAGRGPKDSLGDFFGGS